MSTVSTTNEDDLYRGTLEWLFAQSRRGAARDPARMAALVRALGLEMPPRSVHVVGSNGKGSTAAMIGAGLSASGRAAGRGTGLFVSPHVEDFRERVSVDGERISRGEVVGTLAAWRACDLPLEPAFFEWTFALALSHFAARGVAAAVIEAGIGAARDATLVLDNVALTVLTSVSLEHQALLGPTLADIARDKAAAVRPGAPLVTGVSGAALAVVREVCAEHGSPLVLDDGANPLFDLPADLPEHPPAELHPTRARNARLATAALRLLGADEDALRAAVLSPPLPARREGFHVQGRRVVLDGAHNPAALEALGASLAPGFTLLYGALPHKQGAAGLAVLEPCAGHVILTDAGSEASALEPAGRNYLPDPQTALRAALEATPEGGTLLVTGSFYLVGELRTVLREAALRESGS